MSHSYLTSYQPIGHNEIHETEDEDLSPDSNMVLHIVPQSDKTRWNHIEDLDSFFTRIYQYHQQSGFLCMMVKQFLDLLKFLYIKLLTIFLVACINYDVLFHNKITSSYAKTTIRDCIYSPHEAWANITTPFLFFLFIALVFWIIRVMLVGANYYQYSDIKKFYNVALGIEDANLENVTWDEVKQRLMEVQVEQRMCIHKEALTELDIYHRILRFDNYFIAMVNNNVIPLKIQVPFFGETVFLTRGLRFNLDLLLFNGFYAPFKNNWHLKDEYKRAENRHQLAEALSKKILVLGILNLVFFILIMIFQCLHKLFHVAVMIKREPGFLGARIWSHYARVILRHYNELDHELHARLNRGYRCSAQYIDSFTSRLAAIVGNFMAFITGSIVAVAAVLTIYDEDVIQVEHVLTFVTVFTAIAAACHLLIPKENQVWRPELLLTKVQAEVHYLPDAWQNKAHTTHVRTEFSKLFQYKFIRLIESLVSPIITPFILCFVVRHRSLEIVDFLRNFTVEVIGVGDICSFAQMSLRKHGSRTWHSNLLDDDSSMEHHEDPITRTDHGKTELSLVHFHYTNPSWVPPKEAATFLNALRNQTRRDVAALPPLNEENHLYNSGYTVSQCEGAIATAQNDMLHSQWLENAESVHYRMNEMEGPRPVASSMGMLGSVSQVSNNTGEPTCASNSPIRNIDRELQSLLPAPARPLDMMAHEMRVSTLVLRGWHHKKQAAATYADTPVMVVGGAVSVLHTPRRNEGRSSTESYYHPDDPPTADASYYPSALHNITNTSSSMEVSLPPVFRESTPLLNTNT